MYIVIASGKAHEKLRLLQEYQKMSQGTFTYLRAEGV